MEGSILDDAEIKKIVFNLNRDSAFCPYGLPCNFFQTYKDIVGKDIIRLVVNFFEGNTLPKAITHTNLV